MFLSNLPVKRFLTAGIALTAFSALSHASTNFSLYAYGAPGIGGQPLYYKDGQIVIFNSTDATDATEIYFNRNTDDPGPWTVASNGTGSFTGGQLGLPTSNNDPQVGIVAGTNAAVAAASFFLYGGTVMVENGTDYSTHFVAYNANNTDVLQLVWDMPASEAANMVPVTLRSVPPE